MGGGASLSAAIPTSSNAKSRMISGGRLVSRMISCSRSLRRAPSARARSEPSSRNGGFACTDGCIIRVRASLQGHCHQVRESGGGPAAALVGRRSQSFFRCLPHEVVEVARGSGQRTPGRGLSPARTCLGRTCRDRRRVQRLLRSTRISAAEQFSTQALVARRRERARRPCRRRSPHSRNSRRTSELPATSSCEIREHVILAARVVGKYATVRAISTFSSVVRSGKSLKAGWCRARQGRDAGAVSGANGALTRANQPVSSGTGANTSSSAALRS